jgi:hypothetical protein
MALTTLLVCLQKAIGRVTCTPRSTRSIGLRLMVLCIPLLTGCADPGSSNLNDLAMARGTIGNGPAHGSTTKISLSPTALALSATQGGSDPTQVVTISNSGQGTLDWSVSTTAPWLALSSVSGTAPASFMATVIVAGLAAGTYTATITVTATGATNTPQSIPVDVTISTPTSSTSSSTPTSLTSTPTTASASLAWNAETDPSVIGYYLHYGLQSPNSSGSCTYANSVYFPLTSLANASLPSVSVSGLAPGTSYYFAVSAFNGSESPCSAEVSKTT